MLGNLDELRRRAALPGARVVLDWNGTAVDDAARTREALNVALSGLGLDLPPLDAAAFSARFKLPMGAMLADLGVPEALVGPAIVAWNREIGRRPARLARGTAALVQGLRARGRPASVLSGAAAAIVTAEAAHLGLADALGFVVGDAHPKSAVLRELVRANAGPVLYAGDTEYDMAEAVAAGATPVGFGGGYRPAAALLAAGALAVVADLAELLGNPG